MGGDWGPEDPNHRAGTTEQLLKPGERHGKTESNGETTKQARQARQGYTVKQQGRNSKPTKKEGTEKSQGKYMENTGESGTVIDRLMELMGASETGTNGGTIISARERNAETERDRTSPRPLSHYETTEH